MFGYRHQFDMGVVHLLAIGDELVCQVAIAQPGVRVVARPLPTSHMDFVKGQRTLQPVRLSAAVDPLGVMPLVAVQIRHLGGRSRREFRGKSIRIGLLERAVAVSD